MEPTSICARACAETRCRGPLCRCARAASFARAARIIVARRPDGDLAGRRLPSRPICLTSGRLKSGIPHPTASSFCRPDGLRARSDKQSAFAALSADGVVIGAADLGPLAGGARAVALNDPARFARQARLASADGVPARGALAHVLRVESDIVRAGADVRSDVSFKTEFPRGVFGLAVQHAAGIAATGKVPVLRLTLSGFDTHQNQLRHSCESAEGGRGVGRCIARRRSASTACGIAR